MRFQANKHTSASHICVPTWSASFRITPQTPLLNAVHVEHKDCIIQHLVVQQHLLCMSMGQNKPSASAAHWPCNTLAHSYVGNGQYFNRKHHHRWPTLRFPTSTDTLSSCLTTIAARVPGLQHSVIIDCNGCACRRFRLFLRSEFVIPADYNA